LPDLDVIALVKSELQKHVRGDIDSRMVPIDVDGATWLRAGFRTPDVRIAATRTFRALRDIGPSDVDSVLDAAGQLLSARVVEYRVVAFQWAKSVSKSYAPRHFQVFATWLENYVTGWGSCDDLCVGALGMFLNKYPQFATEAKRWTESNQPMTRRASAVALIYSLRRGRLFEHCFEISDRLLSDPHYLVQKGYGWMLKEATKHFLDEVFDYVVKHKQDMPRLALRYAIEKMPERLKNEAMRRV
jgi:3-methyladenine DNA glycosylase AlkD